MAVFRQFSQAHFIGGSKKFEDLLSGKVPTVQREIRLLHLLIPNIRETAKFIWFKTMQDQLHKELELELLMLEMLNRFK